MAVPGPIYSRASTAPHLMIRNGQAVLVTSAAEVLELISEMGQAMLPLAHGPNSRPMRSPRANSRSLKLFRPDGAPVSETLPSLPRQCSNLPGCTDRTRVRRVVEGDERGWLVAVGGPRG